jgi:hypothetical protein
MWQSSAFALKRNSGGSDPSIGAEAGGEAASGAGAPLHGSARSAPHRRDVASVAAELAEHREWIEGAIVMARRHGGAGGKSGAVVDSVTPGDADSIATALASLEQAIERSQVWHPLLLVACVVVVSNRQPEAPHPSVPTTLQARDDGGELDATALGATLAGLIERCHWIRDGLAE